MKEKINFKKFYEDTKKIVKENILFCCFVLFSTINGIILRGTTIGNYFDVKPILVDACIASFFGLLSFLTTRKKRINYYIGLSILFSAICVINSIYYTYYESFSSISLLATSVFVVDVGDAVVENVLEIRDFLYLWQIIMMYYIYFNLNKKKEYFLTIVEDKKKTVKKIAIRTVLVLAITAIFITPVEWGRFTNLWNRESVVTAFGVYTYQFNDLIQSISPKVTNIFGHDKALKTVTDFYEEKSNSNKKNQYTNIFEGKNVIFIHAESIQELAMELSFNGKEVTPNLNKLASEGIFFSNFYAQVGVGTSSDTEFTLNTSLMPSTSGTVFVNYFNTEFITIPKLLKEKNYYAFSMHANNGDFWNREVMHKNMGYDIFYDKEYYNIDETIGFGGTALSDKSFFKQIIPIIKENNEKNSPYMSTVIMLTNHTPFSDLELMDEYPTTITVNIDGNSVTREYINNTVLGNYFRSVHYADQAIGQFINDLDTEGLLENTVIVIYGDHDARLSKKYYDILCNYDPYTDTMLTEEDEKYTKIDDYWYELNRKVPFIIWTKDKEYNKEIKTPMGMIDVLPTLGNLFNFKSEYQLGKDTLNLTDNTVVFPNGSYLTSKIYYNSQKSEIYSINGEAVDQEYIKNRSEYANKIIEISNNIITYDLIREIKNKEKAD